MNNTTALLDKAKKMCVPPTDYRLAKTLGVSHGRLSHWRREKHHPDAAACAALAKLLGMEFGTILAYVEEDRSKNVAVREFWTAQLPRLLPSIAIGSTLLLGGAWNLIDGGHFNPGKIYSALDVGVLTNLYIMRNWRPNPPGGCVSCCDVSL